ncbi:MAG TPA: MFS transporter [Candidatus Acidoferrum sp.]|nr:MFS transporter [Candidatus Acidoferrum sp.]
MTTQAIALNAAARQRYLLVLLFAGFVLTGVEITLAGPMLPLFIQRWSLTDSQAGIFFTLEFGCSLGGVWLSSLITHYLGSRTSLVLGYLLIGVGLATVNASSMHVALFALGALGTGYGLVVPVTNVTVAEIGGARSASLVSLVNFAWGVGSFAIPLLVLVALKAAFLTKMLYIFAGFGGLLAFSFLFSHIPEHYESTPGSESSAPSSKIGIVITATLAALFFLYVAMEVSIGSWSAAHVKRLPSNGGSLATLAPMFFYGGLMVGRALAPLILPHVRELRLLWTALAVVFVCCSVFVFAGTQRTAFISVTATGLGCAAIFPIYVAWLSRWYGGQITHVRGVMFSMSSIGSASAPGIVGFVSTHAGGLRAGLLVPLACAVLMIFLLLLVRRQAAA